MRILVSLLITGLFGCAETDSNKANRTIQQPNDKVKEELLSLERKWLEAEFRLDTAYISTLMAPTYLLEKITFEKSK